MKNLDEIAIDLLAIKPELEIETARSLGASYLKFDWDSTDYVEIATNSTGILISVFSGSDDDRLSEDTTLVRATASAQEIIDAIQSSVDTIAAD